MSTAHADSWFESLRTGIADPVLDRRMRLFFEAHPPGPSEIERRGVVFDLVTGSKRPEEALAGIAPDRTLRAELTRALEPRPDLDEMRLALVEAGRADEADGLDAGVPLEGGEFEAQAATSRPRRRSTRPSRAGSAPRGPAARREEPGATRLEPTTRRPP